MAKLWQESIKKGGKHGQMFTADLQGVKLPFIFWRARRDSNPQLSDSKSDALSIELRAPKVLSTMPFLLQLFNTIFSTMQAEPLVSAAQWVFSHMQWAQSCAGWRS